MREFDVVVLGAGVAGEVAAGRLGRERALGRDRRGSRLVGGECSFYACMPSKALLRPVELAREVERVPGARDRSDRRRGGARAARRGDLTPGRHRAAAMARGARSHARAGPRSTGRRAARGGRRRAARGAESRRSSPPAPLPLIPDIEGLRDARPWTNIEATTATEVPAAARGPRRRRRRGGARSGLGGVRIDGDTRPSGRAADRAGGAVRRRSRCSKRFARAGSTSGSALGGTRVAAERRPDRARRRDNGRGGRGPRGFRPPARHRWNRSRDHRARDRRPTRASPKTSVSPGTTGCSRSAT